MFQLGQDDASKMLSLPDEGKSKFKYYQRSKRWDRGRRMNAAECDVQSCTPMRFGGFDTKEACE